MRRGPRLAALSLAAICACATEQPRVAVRPEPARQSHARTLLAGPAGPTVPEGTDRAGVVHVVRPGQNLYRIAKAYGVDVAELMSVNGIAEPRALDVGQELFVPGAARVLEVEPAPGWVPPATDPAPAAAPAAPPPPRRVEPASIDRAPGNAAAAAPAFAWPLKGVLYGRFGMRGARRHDGIDIAAPLGTPIVAAADGEVVFVGLQSGYGKVVILRHEDGLVTVYAHNSEVLVREGARVARGQTISKVGQTGRTTGPHLHFEVRDGVKPRDPLRYLP